MRRARALGLGAVVLIGAALGASCVESKRLNGEPCLQSHQCESDYCRAGVCTNAPSLGESSGSLPDASVPPDAQGEASVGDSGSDAALEASPSDGATDAAPDVVDAQPSDGAVTEDAPAEAQSEASTADAAGE